MLKAEPIVTTKVKLDTTTTALKPINIKSDEIINSNMNHPDYPTKQSPSFLKGNYIASVEVNTTTLTVENSTGGGYRKSPISCHSAEEESVRSSSSRVRFHSYS